MDLFTRCPQCDTAFRVTTQQLQASGGQVRCGHCEAIFDAFATLTAQEPQRAPQELTAAAAGPTPQDQSMVESGVRPIPAIAPIPQKGQRNLRRQSFPQCQPAPFFFQRASGDV